MTKRLGFLYALILVAVLATPAFVWLFMGPPTLALYGYVDKIPDRHADPVKGFFNKSWQEWAGRYVDVHFGLRAVLIKSFNELTFRTFRELPRLRVYSTPEQGLYSGLSLEYINKEILNKAALEKEYAARAAKLRAVQDMLAAQGKQFIVVIAASKPYAYPESLGPRYLAGGSADVFARTASFGAALRQAGVSVIDTAPILRAFRDQRNVPTHPPSGLHWNYYAGCVIAEQLMGQVRARFPATQPFSCGQPHYAPPHDVDIDGLSLMNIWTDGGVSPDAPYPTVTPANAAAWRPSFVFISDSFTDQILSSLWQAHAYARFVNSGYFRARALDDSGNGLQQTHPLDLKFGATQVQVLEDIRRSEVVVLQTVDYNIGNYGYDFPEYMLDHYATAPAIAQSALAGQYNGRPSPNCCQR